MDQPLDAPKLRPEFDACPVCQYDLRGLPEGPCPECGVHLGDDAVLLQGVVRGFGSTTPGRRLAQVVLIVWIMLWLPCAGIPLAIGGAMGLSGYALLGAYLTGWLGIIVLASMLFGSRRRRGKAARDQVLLTANGFLLAGTTDPTEPGRGLIAWTSYSRAEVKRLGSTWKRLRLRGRDRHGRSTALDIGVRCSDDEADALRGALADYLATAR
ncbi:MAG: hypothetical protein AAF750_16485 [Planctomycetota bacterium]